MITLKDFLDASSQNAHIRVMIDNDKTGEINILLRYDKPQTIRDILPKDYMDYEVTYINATQTGDLKYSVVTILIHERKNANDKPKP